MEVKKKKKGGEEYKNLRLVISLIALSTSYEKKENKF